jgi:hypothetical protein
VIGAECMTLRFDLLMASANVPPRGVVVVGVVGNCANLLAGLMGSLPSKESLLP